MTRDHHLGVNINFMKIPRFAEYEYFDRYSGEMKQDNLDGYHQINHFHLESFYGKENAEILGKVSEIAHTAPGLAGGKKYYNNNDIQSDYFDVAYYVSISVGKWNKEYEIKEVMFVMSLNKSQVTKLVVDLCWEYDRMSSSGQETLDKLCKVLGIETEAEMDELLASMSKEEINNEILNRSL